MDMADQARWLWPSSLTLSRLPALSPACLRYMADEARSLKAYGELPDNIRVNDTDAFEEEGGENDEYIGGSRLETCFVPASFRIVVAGWGGGDATGRCGMCVVAGGRQAGLLSR